MTNQDQFELLLSQAHEPCRGAIVLSTRSHLEEFFQGHDLGHLRSQGRELSGNSQAATAECRDAAPAKLNLEFKRQPRLPSLSQPRRLYRHCALSASPRAVNS